MKWGIWGLSISLVWLTGCGKEESKTDQKKGGSVEIHAPGISIKAGDKGSEINAPGVKVKADDKGGEVEAPGVKLKSNGKEN